MLTLTVCSKLCTMLLHLQLAGLSLHLQMASMLFAMGAAALRGKLL